MPHKAGRAERASEGGDAQSRAVTGGGRRRRRNGRPGLLFLMCRGAPAQMQWYGYRQDRAWPLQPVLVLVVGFAWGAQRSAALHMHNSMQFHLCGFPARDRQGVSHPMLPESGTGQHGPCFAAKWASGPQAADGEGGLMPSLLTQQLQKGLAGRATVCCALEGCAESPVGCCRICLWWLPWSSSSCVLHRCAALLCTAI